MNQRALTAVASLFLIVLVAVAAAWAADVEHATHHPDNGSTTAGTETRAGGTSPAMPGPEMMQMMEKGQGMMEMMKHMGSEHAMMPHRSGMKSASPAAGMRMMEDALSGRQMMEPTMMRQMMDRAFYLDRVDELGLSTEQVAKLRTIRGACRRDNIRTGAEARIARLDLDDLLSRYDWSLEAAEKLVRQQQKLEADMQVRHLQALAEARQVLTDEQRRMTGNKERGDGMNDLFQ